MAALAWAESVTTISTDTGIEDKLTVLLDQFSEVEVMGLTLITSMMNCINRLSISLGDKPKIPN
jgi:alkylhydroperoxidase family enzyme